MVTDAFARTTLSLYHIPANLFIYSFAMPRKDGRNRGGRGGSVQYSGRKLKGLAGTQTYGAALDMCQLQQSGENPCKHEKKRITTHTRRGGKETNRGQKNIRLR